jgi:muramidase (phage lysozyme)
MDNLSAFLTMIGVSEGTCTIPTSDNGYNVLVGSTFNHPLFFPSYADHPRIYNPKFNSTAAGRYQIIKGTFDHYKQRLDLPDFSPVSQDAIAREIIKDFGAMAAVEAGDIDTALYKLNSQWASFPGGNSGQHQNAPAALRQAFLDSGGTLA